MIKYRKQRSAKIAIAVHVLQNEEDMVISRCCFAQEGKEMFKDSKAHAEPLFCSLNLLFGDVLVAFAVVVCYSKTSHLADARHQRNG